MTKPSIHLNGTSAQSLTDDYVEAMRAVSDAFDKVSKHAAPNGRDYYPQGDRVIDAALAEHRARLTKLAEVKAELEQLAIHCSEFIK